jgi:hypothetical protein
MLTWVLFIPIAIANGVLRETVYKPQVGDLAAHQISTLIASASFLLLAYAMLRRFVADVADRTLLKIGIAWVVATIGFEFGFGHYVDGRSWSRLLRDYDIIKGRVWSLFLLTMLVAPRLTKWLVMHATTKSMTASSRTGDRRPL